jgi:AcrR family transcriptional regulator
MPRRVPEDRFDELLRAATEVFVEQGYRRTQMADVAERLGVAKGTLYLYVESKEALLDAVLRYADVADPIPLPSKLPLATPAPGATLRHVEKRIAESAALPALGAALERRRVADARHELEEIVRELYVLLASHRVAIKLLDRCAADYPELAAVWHGTGRGGPLALLRRYLEDRIRRGRIRPVRDVAVTARAILEIVVFWAVHRHWDPAPEAFDEVTAREMVVELVVCSLLDGVTGA